MGDPANLSSAEIKLALQRWRTPQSEVDACIERNDLVALYRRQRELSEARRAQQERARQQQKQQQQNYYQNSAGGGRAAGGAGGFSELSWSTWALIGLGLVFLLQRFGFIGDGMGPGMGGEYVKDVAFDLADDAYVKGRVSEVSTHSEFMSALAFHKDATGLPVVVDFFSHSCGPCVMIAPHYRRMAKEFKGRAVFLKVDVNRNRETSGWARIRAMPTFQFFANGKKVAEFSGADARRIHSTTSQLAAKAERKGTFVGKEVTQENLVAFYTEHEKSKLGDVPKVAEKYGAKPAKLVRLLKKKYGAAPVVTLKASSEDGGAGEDELDDQKKRSKGKKSKPGKKKRKSWKGAGENIGAALLSTAELRAELDRRESNPSDNDVDEEDYPFVLSLPESTATLKAPAPVVILGGGPAGLTAAIYCARAGLSPIVIAPAFGGQLLGKGVDVENFPGVMGPAATGRGIVQLMRKQASALSTTMVDDVATEVKIGSVDSSNGKFLHKILLNSTSRPLYARSLIVATGADSRWLGVPGEYKFRGRGISSCATCDGFLYRDRDVLVVGGGDTAMEDALVLARTSKSVTIVHRRGAFRASKILSERVMAHPKITVIWNTVVESFNGDGGEEGGITHATLKTKGYEPFKKAIGAAFVAIGHDPNTKMFKGQLDIDDAGYIKTPHGKTSRTSADGVFASGDVADHMYRQAVTSAGSGAMAALDAERWLSEQGLHT